MDFSDKVTKTALTETEEQREILSIKTQINLIEQEIYSSYVRIGKKYVDYTIENGNIPEIDASEILELINIKTAQKQELENQILEILFS